MLGTPHNGYWNSESLLRLFEKRRARSPYYGKGMRIQVSEIGERLRMGHLVLGRASVVHLKRFQRFSD